MRKALLNIHLYGGLICAPYLVIFGLSSLNFNHHFDFAKAGEEKVAWERTLPVLTPTASDQQTAEQVRDSLGMLGWVPPWELKRANVKNLRFHVEHPGKAYKVSLNVPEKKVQVEEKNKGFWQVINSMHGLTGVPNSGLATAWGIYTNFSTFMILFATLSGAYLWAASRRERRMGMLLIGGGVVTSITFLFYVVLRG